MNKNQSLLSVWPSAGVQQGLMGKTVPPGNMEIQSRGVNLTVGLTFHKSPDCNSIVTDLG